MEDSRYKDIIEKIKDWGAVCFSAHPILVDNPKSDDSSIHPDNLLMWSHYGDYHKGMAVAYRRLGFLQKVSYTNKFPIMDLDDTTTNGVPLALIIAILTKSEEWKYENEYRFINTIYSNLLLPEDRIVSKERIYFGLRADPKEIEKVKEATNNSLIYYKAEMVPGEYKLMFNLI